MTSDYKNLFRINKKITYLNHAAVGILPFSATDAMNNIIDQLATTGEPPFEEVSEKLNIFREHIGKLLSIDSSEIAFIHNTTEGLSIALHSIRWKPGDTIIVQADSFPTSLYILNYCFPQLEKKYIPLNDGKDFIDRIDARIDSHTRAIVVDHVHFLSGFRINLEELGKLARKHQLYLIVDGIQAAGVVNINLCNLNVHFYAAGGMKWLLGPMGTGFLYVNQNILNELKVFHIGWLSAEHENLSALYPIKPLVNSARRFERANFNLIGLYGLNECLKLINEIRAKQIERLIFSKTSQFMKSLKKLNCEILTPSENIYRAGIVSFRVRNANSKKVYEQLQNEHIICSLREGWIRISIHFFNTDNELEKVLNLVSNKKIN